MGIDDYKKLSITTDIVMLTTSDKEQINERSVPRKGIQVLLIKRGIEPFKGMWTLPGGFVNYGDTLTGTVEKKLMQKTGIKNIKDIYKEQLYTYGDNINRDPRGNVVTVAYLALFKKEEISANYSDGDNETSWFWVDIERDEERKAAKLQYTNVDTGEVVTELGFDHDRIIQDGLDRLQGKIMYTDVGFHLVNSEFTIKELQMVYEVILGRYIDNPSFRRIIQNKIKETGRMTSDIKDTPEFHRPSKLYRRA